MGFGVGVTKFAVSPKRRGHSRIMMKHNELRMISATEAARAPVVDTAKPSERPDANGRVGIKGASVVGTAVVIAVLGTAAAYAETVFGPLSQSMELNFLLVGFAAMVPFASVWLR